MLYIPDKPYILYLFIKSTLFSIFCPAMNKDQWDPEFLKAIPIMKTRSGMQFSCASPSHSCPENTYEVWVCNSDGYVGQVCLLNIRDEPTVEACIAVCSARIICIAAVPGLKNR